MFSLMKFSMILQNIRSINSYEKKRFPIVQNPNYYEMTLNDNNEFNEFIG